jgi:biopolymer transport protein ExbD
MKLERKRRHTPELFTGTMADVSFLLVIFFVVTAVFSATRGLDFDLGTNEGPIEVEPLHSIDVHVLADGKLMVDGQPMRLDDLLDSVGGKIREAPDKPVILTTDPDSTYGAMVAVLDELRSAPDKAGFVITTLGIPTFREIERDWSRAGASPRK